MMKYAILRANDLDRNIRIIDIINHNQNHNRDVGTSLT